MQVRVCAEVMWVSLYLPLSPCHLAHVSPREPRSRTVSPCPHVPLILPNPIRSYIDRLNYTDVSMGKSSFTVAEIESPLTDKLFVEAHRPDFI